MMISLVTEMMKEQRKNHPFFVCANVITRDSLESTMPLFPFHLNS